MHTMNAVNIPPGGLSVLWRRDPEGNEAERHRRFEEATLVHIDLLYRTALHLARNREHAEDLVQETYLRAYRAFDRFDGRYVRAWLLTILRHTFISQVRHIVQMPSIVEWDEDTHMDSDLQLPASQSAEDEALAGLLGEDLERALGCLTEVARTVLILAYVEELPYAEIARVMACPVGTVMSRLHRARRQLEAQLTPARLAARR